MYIYESNLGGLYASEELIEDDYLYCDECGDSDWFVGFAENKEEALDLLKDITDID